MKNIMYTVIYSDGEKTFEDTPEKALNHIKNLEKEESKWLFVNNDFKSSMEVSPEELVDKTVVLTDAIMGG